MTPLLVGTSDPVQTGTMVADSSMNVEPLMLQTTYPPLWVASPVSRGIGLRIPAGLATHIF